MKLSEEMVDNLLDANKVIRRRKMEDKKQDVKTIPNPLIGIDGITEDNTGIHVAQIMRSKGGKI